MRKLKNRSLHFFSGFVLIVLTILFVWLGTLHLRTSASRDERAKAPANRQILKFQTIESELTEPRLIDFHSPAKNLLLYAGQPAGLQMFPAKSQNKFSFRALSEARSLAAVRGANSRFTEGEVFLGFDGGTIRRISAAGESPAADIRVNDEKAAFDGGLAIDQSGVFGGDLLAVTGAGRIWRIDGAGQAVLLLDLNTPLKGLTILPNDFERYGSLAGNLIVGAARRGGVFAVDADGRSSFFPLEVKAEDIDLIAPNENLFAVSTGSGKAFEFAAENFLAHTGDLLITAAESDGFYVLHWDGAEFEISALDFAEKIDQATFAPLTFSKQANNCVTSLTPAEAVFQANDGEGRFNVNAPANCRWTAAGSAPWLRIISGQSGTGSGTIVYYVTKNPTLFLRDANITVDTLTHRVRQSRKTNLQCILRFNPSSPTVGAIGGGGTVNITGDSQCAWQAVSTVPWLTLTGNVFGAGNGTVSYSVATNFAAQPRTGYIGFAGGSVAITQSPNQMPAINAGADQTIALPNAANLSASVTDDGVGNPVTVSWSKISGTESVLFSAANNLNTTAIFSKEGTYTLRLTATDGYLTASDDIRITVNPDPVPPLPDPRTIAPPINPTVSTNPFDATKFLYTGANPTQTGVAPNAIEEQRVAVLRGRVVNKNGQPIPKVKVTIADHPELGETFSRADGMFDMVVNGGGELAVKYEKIGFISVQRVEKADWQDYEAVEDVVMIPHDDNVTLIDLNAAAPVQVAQSGIISDADGTRRSRLFFKQGTTAVMTLPDNTTQPLTVLNVRSSEFTVGANGPETMPADLPPLSAYTYAAAYTIDEAVAVGAKEVRFNQPVIQYNENFLNFPVGINVPSGALDEESGRWMPSQNGRVVKILSITGGVANLDLDGSGNPASEAAYAALGIDPAERQQLAAIYAVNQSLWRVPVIHFSAWDSNFGFGPPAGSGPPNGGNASGGGSSGGGSSGGGGGPAGSGGSGGSDECDGCILGIQDQRLSEEIDVVGTRFFLRYDSTRPRGNVANYTVRIPLSGATLPGPVKRIEMKITIAGQIHEAVFPALPNQITSFTWDGKDAYGREVQGQQEITIDIGNVYDGVYQNTANFGYNGNGVPISVNTRQEITIHRVQTLLLGTHTAPPQSLGGWSLSEHHAYDPVGQTLFEGNGRRRSVQTVSNKIETFGGGLRGFFGDGGQVRDARFMDPYGVAVAPDGSVYIADAGNSRVRKVAPDGIITTFAGSGGGCNPSNFPCGDGGPATSASFGSVIRVAVAPDGSVYIGGGRNIWRVTRDNIIRRVAGLALDGFSGDGGPARDAQLSGATRFFPMPDGSVYVSDMLNQRIRRIDPNGIITTIAGTGTAGFSGDGGLATDAQINFPGDIVAAPDGNVYFIDQENHRIRRIAPDGVISTYAGTGTFGSSPDGLPALQTDFIFRAANQIESGSLALAPDGSLYVVSYVFPAGGRIRRIGKDGIVTGVAGNGQFGSQGDGGPALQSQMRLSSIGLAPDGSIYAVGGFTFDFNECRVRKISSPLPSFTGAQIAIPSEDGAQLYRFDAQGRHLDTVNTLTGATVFTFNYNGSGNLTSITDGDNNTTSVERDGAGNPTGIRSPYNQLTTFTRDANGFLATVTNPNDEQYQFTYNANGLMLSERDPRNNQNTFTYDAQGRLIRDDDAANGFQTLTRAESGANFTVTHATTLDRQTAFQVNFAANGDRQRINTLPDGTQTRRVEGGNGTDIFTAADGTVLTRTRSGDPRWELQAPIDAAATVATPSGLNLNATLSRAVNLASPGDPLSLIAQTDTLNINGRTFTNTFTAANKTFAAATPQNRQSSTTIDAQGRVTNFSFANLDPFTLAYDTRGRLSAFTAGAGSGARTFNLGYNADGFLSTITNPLNQTISLTRDAAGRVTRRTLADNRNINFGYDAKGNPTSFAPPGRPAHIFTYNALDDRASYTAPNVGGSSSTTVYQYNLDRDLTRVTRPDKLQINYAYDAAGRLQTITAPNGSYTFAYNAATGTINNITAPDGGVLAYQYDGFLQTRQTWTGTVAGNVSHTFDNNFRIASQSVNGANTVNFTYDNDNLLTGAGGLTLTRNAQNGFMTASTLGSVTDGFSYNDFGEPTNYNARFNATVLYDVNYAYDKLGRITQKVETVGGVASTFDYGYDLTGRLTTVTLNGVPLAAYTYDDNDNRTSINVGGSITNAVYDAQDRLTNYGAATYAYTLNGELSAKTIGGQVTQYGYDVLGNLRSVNLPDGTQIEYVIDAQNRRTGKKTGGVLTKGFLYQDQLEPVAELDGANNVVSRFVYGTRRNTPDYMIKGGATYRIICDQTGSVRLVVDVSTGAIAQRIDYDAFGIVSLDTNPGFQPFGFAGGIYDPQTGLTRFGARDYDAGTGRWTAKDPILFDGGDTNLYSYAFADPVNQIDPSGFAPHGGGSSGGGKPNCPASGGPGGGASGSGASGGGSSGGGPAGGGGPSGGSSGGSGSGSSSGSSSGGPSYNTSSQSTHTYTTPSGQIVTVTTVTTTTTIDPSIYGDPLAEIYGQLGPVPTINPGLY